ncbi:MAG: hypothetical protein IJX03_00500 [Clostridia bacterium]|nr:hypothetical protein [Clostridia bacterium]
MKNSIKKFSVLFLSFAFILCTLALTVFGFNSAKADSVAEFSVYQMEESVSIKQVENGGIRFRVKMDANTKALIDSADDVTYGFIITPVYFYENRAADTAETPAYGVDDYISSIAKYAGEPGVGILGNKEFIYQDGEYFYANGVLEGIGKDSPDLKYIAIAYVKDGSGFKYATFDADNAIDIKTAASKIYLNDEDNDIETIRKIDILDDFGKETNPVLISDNADMYALSSATNSGVITGKEDAGTGVEETINFKLLTDITFDCHATPVASDFAGAVDYNGKTIDLVNGGANPIAHAFAGHTDDCTICNPVESLITMTPKISNVISGTSWPESYVANEDFSFDCGNYTGDMWKVSPKNGILQIKIFYSAEELTALSKKYNKVKFSYYLDNPAGTSVWFSDGNGKNILNDLGYGSFANNKWATIELPMENVLENVSNGWLSLASQGSSNAGDWTIYFSDFDLIFDFDLLDADTANTTSLRYAGASAWGSIKSTRVANANLPVAGYDGAALQITLKTKVRVYATLAYGATEITELATNMGVTHIRINYLVVGGGSPWGDKYGFMISMVKGSWQQLEVPVADFVAALGEAEGGSTGTHITDKCLFLHYAGYTNQPEFYLGDIEFVQPVA